MKLLKLAHLLMFATAAYGVRSFANARRNATAAASPALSAQTPPQVPANSEMTTMLDILAGLNGKPIVGLSTAVTS